MNCHRGWQLLVTLQWYRDQRSDFRVTLIWKYIWDFFVFSNYWTSMNLKTVFCHFPSLGQLFCKSIQQPYLLGHVLTWKKIEPHQNKSNDTLLESLFHEDSQFKQELDLKINILRVIRYFKTIFRHFSYFGCCFDVICHMLVIRYSWSS